MYQTFGDCSVHIDYNWYKGHFRIPCFFPVLLQDLGTYVAFSVTQFYPVVIQNTIRLVVFFFNDYRYV